MKKIDDKTLSNIQGGSAVGILGGSLGRATTGVKVCTPGGPWAMAACGIGGAVIGGAFAAWTGA